MEIALIIVGGLTAMTIFAGFFGYLTEKNKKKGPIDLKRLEGLEAKVKALEAKLEEGDTRVGQLEGELSFFKKLLDDKSK